MMNVKIKKLVNIYILVLVTMCLYFIGVGNVYAAGGNKLHFIGGRSGNYATLIEATYKEDSKKHTHYAMVDLGKKCDFKYIKKYLEERNVKLDFLIITHAHTDHYGGEAATVYKLVKNKLTESDFYVIMKEKTANEEKLADAIRKKGINIVNPTDALNGYYAVQNLKPLELRMYNTGKYEDNYEYNDGINGGGENAQSIVIQITGKKYTAALYGDMSYYGGRTIADAIGNVSFYAAFHHGVSCRMDSGDCSEKWTNDTNGKIGTASTAKYIASKLNPKYTLISKKGKKTNAYSKIDNLGKIYYQMAQKTTKNEKGKKVCKSYVYKNYAFNLSNGNVSRQREEIKCSEYVCEK